MFFCEPCRDKNNWPGIVRISEGPCECCGKTSLCYDVPSKYLPRRRPVKTPSGTGWPR